MTTYAYARVSAADQNLSRQMDAFTSFGIEKNHIFSDKKSYDNIILELNEITNTLLPKTNAQILKLGKSRGQN